MLQCQVVQSWCRVRLCSLVAVSGCAVMVMNEVKQSWCSVRLYIHGAVSSCTVMVHVRLCSHGDE